MTNEEEPEAVAPDEPEAKEDEADDAEVPPPPEPHAEKRVPKHLEPPPPEHYLTHFPKHPNCEICTCCKVQREQCRAKKNKKKHRQKDFDGEVKPKKFADEITADHHILGDEEASRHGDKVA